VVIVGVELGSWNVNLRFCVVVVFFYCGDDDEELVGCFVFGDCLFFFIVCLW
jgi:hypothetical protein